MAFKILVYPGKSDKKNKETGLLQSEQAVLELLKGFENKGHKIYLDQGYSTIRLVEMLHERGFRTLGTIQQNRKNFPTELKKYSKSKNPTGLKLAKDERKAVQCGNVVIQAWHDRKIVSMITDFVDPTISTKVKRHLKGGKGTTEIEKPEMNSKYSKNMKGVDMMTQREAAYNSSRKTHRWYMKFLVHIFEIAMINSHNVFVQNEQNSSTRLLAFRMAVIKSLTQYKEKKVEESRKVGCPAHHLEPSDKRRRCSMCKQAKSNFQCAECINLRRHNVALCVHPCFKEFHDELSEDDDGEESNNEDGGLE